MINMHQCVCFCFFKHAHVHTHPRVQMGVVEAIKASLATLPQQSITLRYLLSGSGDITLSDVDLAAASGGLILGFNLDPNDAVETHAKRQGVRVMTYKVGRLLGMCALWCSSECV